MKQPLHQFQLSVPVDMVPTQPFERTIGEFGAVSVILWVSKALPANRVAYLFEEQAKALETFAKSCRSDKVLSVSHAAELVEKSKQSDPVTPELRTAIRAISPMVERIVDATFAVTRSDLGRDDGAAKVMALLVELDRACVEFVEALATPDPPDLEEGATEDKLREVARLIAILTPASEKQALLLLRELRKGRGT